MSKSYGVSTDIRVQNRYAYINITVSGLGNISSPHISVRFANSTESRRIRMNISSVQKNSVTASLKAELDSIFYKDKTITDIAVSFFLSCGSDLNIPIGKSENIKTNLKAKRPSFIKANKKEKLKMLAAFILNALSAPFNLLRVKQNRVLFLSNRTSEPSGNLKAVMERFSLDRDIKIKTMFTSGGIGISRLFRFLILYNTSAVVFVDDYYHLISYVKKKDSVCLVQLWHACGAFKTIGFSRLGTDSLLQQSSPNHRQYDIAVVSSRDVAPCYAEGFAISDDKVLPLGSPRCDKLIDSDYQQSVKNKFYCQFPELAEKKIILFAPTFRGGGNGDAYYPFEGFDVDLFLKSIPDDYALVIKMHPYVNSRPKNAEAIKSRYYDLSESDINDLLIVTDLLITDYSSVMFEAALLQVPMLFYAFDLDEYISSRDFYIDYKSFVPGVILRSFDELVSAVGSECFESEKTTEFCSRYFGGTIGKGTDNVYRAIKQYMSGE